jgi:hypothetical protein
MKTGEITCEGVLTCVRAVRRIGNRGERMYGFYVRRPGMTNSLWEDSRAVISVDGRRAGQMETFNTGMPDREFCNGYAVGNPVGYSDGRRRPA